jgi:hypothetical protein
MCVNYAEDKRSLHFSKMKLLKAATDGNGRECRPPLTYRLHFTHRFALRFRYFRLQNKRGCIIQIY